MRLLSTVWRVASTVAGTLAPSLLLIAATVDAAPLRAQAVRTNRAICDSREAALLVRQDVSRRHSTSDEEAIQTDDATLDVADESPLTAALAPAGSPVLLEAPLHDRYRFSPRSPRGPPAHD